MGLKRRRFEDVLSKQSSNPREEALEGLGRLLSQGRVVPVISNSFWVEQIFGRSSKALETDQTDISIYEQLAQVWAEAIGYPGPDSQNLAGVAKFYITEQMEDAESAKAKYLTFLSNVLLAFAEDDEDPGYVEVASRLRSQINARSFSEIARELDYPRFRDYSEDPLRLLAKLPMPVYITTSYFDFMERALEMEVKRARTQVIFWSGQEYSVKDEHKYNRDIIPTEANPVVYHVHGLENYPRTLVLSEDDYLSFLIAITSDNDTVNPLVPLELRQRIADSSLLLLGYHPRDWEFRTLMKFIRQNRRDMSPRGIVTQSRSAGNVEVAEKSVEYLTRYFEREKFSIEWSGSEEFILKLWNQWIQQNRS